MGDGPPGFRRNFSCSAVLRILLGVFHISSTGFLPSLTDFSKSFDYLKERPYWSPTTQQASLLVWAFPVSLAATQGIEFSFSSCRYLDVSVLCVYLECAMYSHNRNILLKMLGSPIRKSLDHSLRTAPQSISVLVPSFIGS